MSWRLFRRRREDRRSAWYFLRDFRRVFPYVRPYRRLALGSVSMIGMRKAEA